MITSLLHKRAGWLVASAWLLLVLAILANFTLGVTAGIDLTYHPHHEAAPYDRELITILYFSFGIGLIAALGSTFLLVLRWRMISSLVVVVLWAGFAAGAATDLALVKKGPQEFDLYAGELHFRIPWQYGPSGSERPTSSNGISLFLCFDSLLGGYDAACVRHLLTGELRLTQVSIYPPKLEFMGG